MAALAGFIKLMTLCWSNPLQVSECVWADEHRWSGEEGGGRVTWETRAMEVKGHVISVPGEEEHQTVFIWVVMLKQGQYNEV